MIWLESTDSQTDEGPLEREIADDLETLPPQGYFNPSEWKASSYVYPSGSCVMPSAQAFKQPLKKAQINQLTTAGLPQKR